MAGQWQHFAHDADIGVCGTGDTLDEAFAAAARAMTAVVVDPDTIRTPEAVAITCTGATAENLLYNWLNEIVYEMAVRRMVFARFDVAIRGDTLTATAHGEAVDRDRHAPTVEVKGATMTALNVHREGDQWVAGCVVDV